MPRMLTWVLASDLRILLLLGVGRLLLHVSTNGQYGFHRDELATLDDARHLDWGYVAYPPLTPAIARVALEMFGPSLIGLRLFSAAAVSVAMVVAGLIARDLGGGRWAQVIAVLACAVAPISLIQGSVFQYVAFDYLWWVLLAAAVVRLLRSSDPRWWLAIGALIGLGLLTRYTMAFGAAGLVGGVLLTDVRRYLRSRWLWLGVGAALLITLPNLVWQAQHDFVSLEFLRAIHERDVRIGRTEGFLVEQALVSTSLFTFPIWLAGLWFYFRAAEGQPFRLLGWLYVIALLLFLLVQGRSYYLAPAYPMLFAAGSVVLEQWLRARGGRPARMVRGGAWTGLGLGGALGCVIALPVAPIGSAPWSFASGTHDTFTEEIGWPELAETVAGIYTSLPPEEQNRTTILTGNYGEAGAINLYGPSLGLPRAISGVNSYSLRGYGEPPPRAAIVLGFRRQDAAQLFERCDLAGHVTNRQGVLNEESRDHPDVLLCRGPRQPWPILWPQLRRFG